MLCYRLFENIPQRSSLGFGPAAGRWNYAGTPLIYTAHSVALAFLELYSIRGSQVALSKWILATLELPNELRLEEKHDCICYRLCDSVRSCSNQPEEEASFQGYA